MSLIYCEIYSPSLKANSRNALYAYISIICCNICCSLKKRALFQCCSECQCPRFANTGDGTLEVSNLQDKPSITSLVSGNGAINRQRAQKCGNIKPTGFKILEYFYMSKSLINN